MTNSETYWKPAPAGSPQNEPVQARKNEAAITPVYTLREAAQMHMDIIDQIHEARKRRDELLKLLAVTQLDIDTAIACLDDIAGRVVA